MFERGSRADAERTKGTGSIRSAQWTDRHNVTGISRAFRFRSIDTEAPSSAIQ